MGSDDTITYENPGTIDLQRENPALYAELQNLQELRGQFRADSSYALDPARYDARMRDSMATNQTAMQNRFANMGLAGSSTAMGAMNESDRLTQFAWDDRRLNDMMNAMKMEAALSGQIGGNINAIQGQFANTQNNILGLQQQANAQEQQMWSTLATVGGGIAGTLLAPGVGTAVGAGLGGQVGGAMASPSLSSNYSVGSANGMYGGSTYPSYYGFGGY